MSEVLNKINHACKDCFSSIVKNNRSIEAIFIFYRLPPPKLPSMNVLSEVVTEAFGVALVGYVASLALAQSSAKRFNYTVDDNQVKFFLFT